jgi:hypothetical protein
LRTRFKIQIAKAGEYFELKLRGVTAVTASNRDRDWRGGAAEVRYTVAAKAQ